MKIKFSKPELWLLGVLLGFLIMVYGGMSNDFVISKNNNKMPVYFNVFYQDEDHFSFNSSNKPEFWVLSDVIEIGDWMISIGDIMLFFGGIMTIFCLGAYFVIKIKEVKNEILPCPKGQGI